MAHLVSIIEPHKCDACRAPARGARRELLSYAREHMGFYCIMHSEAALQHLRSREAAALLHPPLPMSIAYHIDPPTER